jgi:hypothetical protein
MIAKHEQSDGYITLLVQFDFVGAIIMATRNIKLTLKHSTGFAESVDAL